MDRREAIQTLSIISGGLIGASAFGWMLEGCNEPTSKAESGEEFSKEEEETVARMTGIIIPRTTIAGAMEVDVPAFVLMMMQECYPQRELEHFRKGIKLFNVICSDKYKNEFLNLTSEKQIEAVGSLDHHVLGEVNEKERLFDEVSSFYRNLKGLTLLGYFSSEPGATEALRYIQVPEHYEGCIPYRKGDKAWAT